jgi:hypothetical protein
MTTDDAEIRDPIELEVENRYGEVSIFDTSGRILVPK